MIIVTIYELYNSTLARKYSIFFLIYPKRNFSCLREMHLGMTCRAWPAENRQGIQTQPLTAHGDHGRKHLG